jgi:hypothetical protein
MRGRYQIKCALVVTRDGVVTVQQRQRWTGYVAAREEPLLTGSCWRGLARQPVVDDTRIEMAAFWQRSLISQPNWGQGCRISPTSNIDGVMMCSGSVGGQNVQALASRGKPPS